MPISFINITKALSGVSKENWSSCKYWLKVLVPSQHRARIMNIERLLKSDNTVKRTGDVGDGILLAPKQGKKNLAKFLGIDLEHNLRISLINEWGKENKREEYNTTFEHFNRN